MPPTGYVPPLADMAQGLESGPVRLVLEGVVPAVPEGELVPYFHFRMVDAEGKRAGHINFRVGNTRHVLQSAGHVGFEVLPEHRGRAYAYHACRALAPFLRLFYSHVVLTADPANAPSIRILEKLGARFQGEVEVESDDPAYAGGARRKRRYLWTL